MHPNRRSRVVRLWRPNILREHFEHDVGRLLHKAGFERKGNYWRRDGALGIEVVHIQGARSGTNFLISLCVYRGGEPYLYEPRLADCEGRVRLSHEGKSPASLFAAITKRFASRGGTSHAPAPTAGARRVRHPEFGEGTIVSDRDNVARVLFDDQSRRLIAKGFLIDINHN